ncbi:MAG: S8 family serine peptidase, partial [Clostridia bacterium]|nr:S8 family serine peptidase [Clostridia bacterium]
MKFLNKRLFVIFTALALFFSSGAVFALPKEDGKAENRVAVIVEVEGDAVLAAKNASKLGAKEFLKTGEAKNLEKKARATQSSVLASVSGALGEEPDVTYTYTHVLNGFAMLVDADKVASLYALPNVKKVYVFKDEAYTASPEEQEVEAEAELFESEQTGDETPENSEEKPYIIKGSEYMDIQYMHDNGYTGKGTVIAVIDSCLDPTHEMFSAPVANPRLSRNDIAEILQRETLSVSATNAGRLSVSRVYRSEKIPFLFNYYTLSSDALAYNSDHGLHVAGIAAGNNGIDFQGKKFIGTAPDAQILFMATACDNDHGLDSPSIIAAMEDAVILGADVINCSLTASTALSEEPKVKAANAARSAGIMVANAAGNSGRGDNILYVSAEQIDYNMMVSLNDISAGTSVANADGHYTIVTFKKFTVAGKEIYYNRVFNETDFNEIFGTETDFEYVYANEARESDFENLNAEGKLVFANQYGIPFNEKVTNAYNAGAAGIFIIYGETPDVATGINPAWRFFPVGVTGAGTEEVILEAEEKKLRFNKDGMKIWQKNGALSMDSYSSWGLNAKMELKPEISATGENIYSASFDNGYVLHSGTSMATPFYAGASALMFEYMAANPDLYAPFGNRATLAENLLMSTANIVMENEQEGIPYSPRKQGAGILNVKKAVKTPVFLLGDELEADGYVFRKSKISLREIALDGEDSFKFSFTARNMTDADVTYDEIGMYVTTDSADEKGMIKGARPLYFTSDLPDSFTVPAFSSADLTVKVTLDKDELEENLDVFVNGFYIDGFVTLKNTFDEENIPDLSIPFT